MKVSIYRRHSGLFGQYKRWEFLQFDEDGIAQFLNKGDYYFPKGTAFRHEVVRKVMGFHHYNCGGGDPCTKDCKWELHIVVKKL